jgi:uncharacterized RDD family membrane protein YckC
VSPVFPPCYVAEMTAPTHQTDQTDQSWPGERLGLPQSGPGAVAGWGRRILALFVDWVLASLVASLFTQRGVASPPEGIERWLPLWIFALEVWLLTATMGASAGQLLARIAVRGTNGGRLGLLHALERTLLICLVIPPLIFNRDQRGLHDLAVGSIVVRR